MTPQRHGGSFEKTSREKTLNWSRLKVSPSHSLIFAPLFILICLHLSSVCVIFSVVLLLLASLSCSCSCYLLCLSFFGSCQPLLSVALLVWLLSLPLTLFLYWLPTHSFLYACLLTNGRGRCSPRCLKRADRPEPLKALESAPRWPSPLSGMACLQKPFCHQKTAKLSCAHLPASTHTHTCRQKDKYDRSFSSSARIEKNWLFWLQVWGGLVWTSSLI